MPHELPSRAPGLPKAGAACDRENRDWIFKPIPAKADDLMESALEAESARRAARLRGFSSGPVRMYHRGGRFHDGQGERFDYIFPELLEDPALPSWVFERVPFLLRGTNDHFQPRRAARDAERIVVGLRYGHGDIPRHSATEIGC
jgi:hypothetical protein